MATGAGVVSGAGGVRRGRWPFWRPLRMRAKLQNLGAPQFRGSISASTRDDFFFAQAPNFPDRASFWVSAGVALRCRYSLTYKGMN
jgi:hypothetical protein